MTSAQGIAAPGAVPTRGAVAAAPWPSARLGDALGALARHSGLPDEMTESSPPPAGIDAQASERLGSWIDVMARRGGFEVDSIELSHSAAAELLERGGPALVPLSSADGMAFLALCAGGGRRVRLLAPDGTVRSLPRALVREALCGHVEQPVARDVDRLLDSAGVPSARRAATRSAIVQERLADTRLGTCWLLRIPPGADFLRQLRQAGLTGRLAGVVVAHAAQYVLWVVSWWMVGRAALEGRLDRGWLVAWLLLLLTLVPLRSLATWLQGRFAYGAGARLKQRLLHGAMRLEPEEVRSSGAGQFIGRVMESEAVESLALTGGILALVAGVELIVAAVVLATGAGNGMHALLLALWLVFILELVRRYARARRVWATRRIQLTYDLVEKMVGHRTRLAQQSPALWHQDEDHAVERYLGESGVMDRIATRLVALAPRGWLVIGLLGLLPAFVSGRATPAAIGIGLGGMLLAYRAIEKLVWGAWHLCDAGIAWDQAAPLFHAAARPEIVGSPRFMVPVSRASGPDGRDGRAILDASDLVFRHRNRSEPVLRGCTLRVHQGERTLLQGASGGGKSTLASLLVGLREPDSGLVLLDGLDLRTLGTDGWRRRVTAAPQFHENHVLAETFAFNLLMGRRWPPQPEDVAEAERICRELGLGPLLERMPAGLLQMVGDTGWQLSHGERSRLYIARALLQGAELVVLDESFAALDPESLEQALRCVLARAPALLVIAHP